MGNKQPPIIRNCQPCYIENDPVNSNNVFENFMEGECNEFARSCALSIAENLGEKHPNPFVIFGKTGLGKTHLLQAILNNIQNAKPEHRSIYIQSESFCSSLTDAIKNQSDQAFLTLFSEEDVFILDDLNGFEGKPKTQQILRLIIDRFLHLGKQVILSTSVLPNEIRDMDVKLLSRISKGLLVELTLPNSQTMLEILQDKVKQSEFDVSKNTLETLAAKKFTCVREMEGKLITLIAKASHIVK